MSEGYYPLIEWDDKADLETKVKAQYNILNWLSREMSIGRVPSNKQELQNNINLTEKRITTPLSIAFVKMAEKGDIDEITASENVNLFLEWNEHSSYKANDLRQYNGKLYKCLQAHTGQVQWTPDISASLWKELGINENGIMEWSQPISSADAYNTGDEVMFNGVHYRSLIDNNVWSPETYPTGWEIVEG
jgi:hypothetical protein